MALKTDSKLTPTKLSKKLDRLFDLTADKISSIEKKWKPENGTPVFTVRGKFTSRGWTEWTQGFQFGCAILQFDATRDESFLELGRRKTVELMATHVSHIGVHDHGFNNVSTYGNLLRLMKEGAIPFNESEKDFYELALKITGAVQASRWTQIADGTGYIHSFNGAHSLFVDTIRSCRALAVSHGLGHVLMGEQDRKISLLARVIEHATNTARYSVYYGKGRDAYDLRGRTTHEAVFNVRNGVFRCPSTQQGYSAFTTWTRGLAWAMCGFAEELEFLRDLNAGKIPGARLDAKSWKQYEKLFLESAKATSDFYIENTCTDGIPMWDTGAPNLHRLGNYLSKKSNPYNAWEPVDSSAAAIAAQGLIRLGDYLKSKGDSKNAARYRQAGLTVANTLLDEPYLSVDRKHQGILLHSVYHHPNGWDHIPKGQKVPCGESSMWGDYHMMELAVMLQREANGKPSQNFYDCL